ncbi:MAG: nucleoside hydrolase, partial [Acidimicrobiales bacterium]
LDPEARRLLLTPPAGPVRVIIDTDAANEIDDQFALTWALLSPERITVEAIVAEPYSFAHHRPRLIEASRALADASAETRSSMVDDVAAWARGLRDAGVQPEDLDLVGPDEGMERSYEEIRRVLAKLGRSADGLVHRGAPRYLAGAGEPIDSEGARRIIECASSDAAVPLYVLAIGCVTNVASALLLEPAIASRIVVVWTSGYPTSVSRSNEASLNLVQDRHASRLLFDSGVPLVYLPGYHVGAQLRVSLPEIKEYVRGQGAIGDYLYHLYTHNPIHAQRAITDLAGRTWVMWDLINVAWVLDPRWVPSELVPTPTLDGHLCWAPRRVATWPMREAYAVDRDAIFRDFHRKLAAHAATTQESEG